MKKFLLTSLAFVVFAACQSPKPQSADLLVLNANLVDIPSGKQLPGRAIAISKDTIVAVLDMDEPLSYSAKDTLDARNGFVIPGLWDMHVHFRGGDSLVSENQDLLSLYLDHGVTSVRDAGGDISLEVLEWREKIRKGQMQGPSLFTSGPKLDGADPAWPGSIKVKDLEAIPGALDSLEKLQVDYVKMYDGSLTKEVFYGIIEEAERRGLKTTGHMPLSADLLKAVKLGLDGSEHLYYILKACSPRSDSLAKENPGYGMMTSIIETYDPRLAREVFQTMHAEEVYITPTLHIGKTLNEILQVDHSKDSLLAHIGSGIQQTYQGRIEGAKRARAAGSNFREKMGAQTLRMIKPMYDEGVLVLAGSDSGPFNSFVYPGASLIDELERLTAAGLSPREALSTSVINGPAFFGLEEHYGSIDRGKVADLLILKNNPLDQIENLREIQNVVHKGSVVR